MLRQDSPSITPDGYTQSDRRHDAPRDVQRVGSLDIQRELNRLEEMILDSPRIPLSRRTLIDEEQFLDQLDLVRLSLPEAFHEAMEIAQHRDEILDQAEQYAQEIVEEAERRAAQILNETGIIQRAEQEAQQIRNSVQQECETIQQQTIAQIEQMRRQAQQDLEEMRRLAIEESEDVQNGADEYADKVLRDMESQMSEMLRIVRNGRAQLQINQPQPKSMSPKPNVDRKPQ
ncbi:ATP synthase F0 subunit B [Leptolyngbya sp. NIES-2104]|uniref:ATP synthase F0 subunit B n=1 Tax=Leptolyngbya sp. NIES-2104 TaxID=1552121 RepID=UPI0006EC5823|nr:ATP synthase F0 subunit B [Leptolyngbya sp. NIES-2104]GAP95017.1 cell division initiation protein [Leptolyngbya sp. NIES-2104]